MNKSHPPVTGESAILSRLVNPAKGTLPASAARAILQITFSAGDRERMNELAAKNRDGVLTEEEHAELNDYLRIGSFLSLLKAKARRSLKPSPKRA